MEELESENYFGKIIAKNINLAMKVMRFATVLGNTAIKKEEFDFRFKEALNKLNLELKPDVEKQGDITTILFQILLVLENIVFFFKVSQLIYSKMSFPNPKQKGTHRGLN